MRFVKKVVALVYLRPESMGGGIGDLLHGIQRELDDDPNAPDLTRTDGVGTSPTARAARLWHRRANPPRHGSHPTSVAGQQHPDLPGLQAFGLTITGTVPFADDESDD